MQSFSKSTFQLHKLFPAEPYVYAMLRYTLLVLILILAAIPAISKAGPPPVPEGEFFSGDKPVQITSRRMTASNRERKAVFEGDVKVTQDGAVMLADWMEVTYSDRGEILYIIAKGGVTLTHNNREIKAEEAHYSRTERTVVFTGNPVARDGLSLVKGSKMTYHIDDGRSEVEDSTVIIQTGKESDG